MTKLKLLGAAALVLSSALAGPAMAQQVMNNPGRCVQYDPAGNCMRFAASYRGDRAWRNDDWNNNGWQESRRDTGFWPGDVAAGVVGGAVATADAAVGTAGAIAAAPLTGNDSYAYYNDGYNNWNDWNHQSYAQRNGFVCTPGTWFKGEDGRNHICQ
jgi:hypothetical protein